MPLALTAGAVPAGVVGTAGRRGGSRPASSPFDSRALFAPLSLVGVGGQPAARVAGRSVLVAAYAANREAMLVVHELTARGVPCVFPAVAGINDCDKMSWRIDRASMGWDGVAIEQAELRSVYLDLGAELVTADGVAAFADSEWRRALDGWWRSLDVPVVNPPAASSEAANKLGGLGQAVRDGFEVPDTLVTNDGAEARAFAAEHDGRVIIKPLFGCSVPLPDGRVRLATTLVGEEALADDASIAAAPCLLQAYVPKAFEVRATVIGERVFAAALDSQSVPAARIDVRAGLGQVPITAHELPAEVAQRCIDHVASLGLICAGIDLVARPDRTYVYLEANPRFGWWFVERRTGQPITAAVADLLCGGSRS